jgi:hypothetical protein
MSTPKAKQKPQTPVRSTRLVRPDVFGWFDSPDQTTPAHDPGLKTICPVCVKRLSVPMKTISLMPATGSDRSYFFRVHKHCWEGISEHERGEIEGALIDEICCPRAPVSPDVDNPSAGQPPNVES